MPPFVFYMIDGMFLMFLCICLANRFHARLPMWEVLVISVFLTVFGYLGARIMAFIETGHLDGRSYYGAVFLVPVLMFPVSKLLRINYGMMMDISAPAGCVMLALLKIKCLIDGCCRGRMIHTANGAFRFPSQIVESAVAVVLMFLLVAMNRNPKCYGKIYAWYLVIYGGVRFILNLFRETKPWIGPLPSGNFWSLIAIILGTGYLVSKHQKMALS